MVTAVVDVLVLDEVEVDEVLVEVLDDELIVLRGPRKLKEDGKAEIRLKNQLQLRLIPLKKNTLLKLKDAMRDKNLDSGRHAARQINNKNTIKKKPC